MVEASWSFSCSHWYIIGVILVQLILLRFYGYNVRYYMESQYHSIFPDLLALSNFLPLLWQYSLSLGCGCHIVRVSIENGQLYMLISGFLYLPLSASQRGFLDEWSRLHISVNKKKNIYIVMRDCDGLVRSDSKFFSNNHNITSIHYLCRFPVPAMVSSCWEGR